MSGLERARGKALAEAGVRKVDVRASATAPASPPQAGAVRLLQYNVLADGLSNDGFVVNDCLSKWPAGGGRVPLQAGGSAALSESIAEVMAAKASGDERALAAVHLKYDHPLAQSNLAATVAWKPRWLQMQCEIAALQPTVVTLQEVDRFEEVARDLAALGYACGDGTYVPAHAAAPDSSTAYLDHLARTGVAFAPSLPSTARKIAQKNGRKGADDMGCAVFWRADAMTLKKLDFLAYAGSKSGKHLGAVKATLLDATTGEPLTVICAHLGSGASDGDEERRQAQLAGRVLTTDGLAKAGGLREWFAAAAAAAPTVLALDMNSAPQTPKVSSSDGRGNCWSSLRGVPRCASVWDAWFDPDGAPKAAAALPVSTNKLRGPCSGQPSKIGEHAMSLIDHVFFASPAAAAGLALHAHVRPPVTFASATEALENLLPSLANPSDHVPVVVDFAVGGRALRGGAGASPGASSGGGRSYGNRVRTFGILGVLVSAYAWNVEYQLEMDPFHEPMCNTAWGSCAAVFSSAYAKPLSLWGLVPSGSALDLSLATAGMLNYGLYALYGVGPPWSLVSARTQKTALFGLSCVGICFSCYLLYVLKVVLKDFCIVCTTFHCINFSMFFFAARPEFRRR